MKSPTPPLVIPHVDIDVNYQNAEGDTLLHSAAVKGDVSIATILLSRGANYNLYNQRGQTPLFMAVKFGNERIVELFLQKEYRCDVNFPEFEQGESPLHMAALKGFERIAFMLLIRGIGINVNSRDLQNYTPLHHACIYGRPPIVRFLLNCRADANAKSSDGYTPLHAACVIGNREIAEMLLENKADINQHDHFGYTALAFAVREGREEMVQMLLQRGAIVNAKTNDGFSILHLACHRSSQRIVKSLIQRAKVDQPSASQALVQKKDGASMSPSWIKQDVSGKQSGGPLGSGFTKWLFDLGADLMRSKEGDAAIDYVELYSNTVAFITKMQGMGPLPS
jgi:ankyrin repeat protein